MTENKKPENPSAFPLVDCADGMTLRDYFAAKAMQSVLSNQTFLETVLRDAQVGTLASDAVSRTAFVMADAMLKQREL
jgi:hypothetical protein